MSTLLIYTPQNGEFFKIVLDAVAAIFNKSAFSSAVSIMMTFAALMTGYQYVRGKKIEALMRYIVTGFFVSYGLLGLKVSVGIIDMQADNGAGEALVVNHVPIGLALPAAMISGMGYGVTTLFSMVFHMPAELDYNKTGMVFGSRTWLAATNAGLAMSPDLSADTSAYIRQCIFAAKLLGSQQLTPQELVNSDELIKTFFDKPSPIYRVIMHDGKNLSCIDAAANLQGRINGATSLELSRLSRVMSDGDEKKFGDTLSAADKYYMGISKGAAEILTQNMLINAVRNAASDAFSFAGADAALMNYTNTDSMQKMHVAEANSFWLASFRLPYYMTVMLMVTICIFPLIVLLSILPLTRNVYVMYLQSQAYLWSWPPMFIIIHFLVSIASEAKMNIFGEKVAGVTFSNIDALASQHSNFAYTAGALAASVPFLAYYITKGLSSVLSNASQHFGGMAQSLSVSEAQSAAAGHVSMATYSGWNMNYDNTSAHKFDTNRMHAEGRSSIQMPNSSMLSQNVDGSRVGNVQNAISSGAVSVHGSERVVDSLHQSANESFNHAMQLRTAADSHLQSGLNDMKHFNVQDSNDYRSGEGVSNSTSASIGQDLRVMKDAVDHYNKHHDTTWHAGGEVGIHTKLSSEQSVPGKLVKYFTGFTGDATASGRAGVTGHFSDQRFNNSSEGKAFNEAYHHMITTAQNSHLDTADAHNLSKSEQIAANFLSSQSLMKQASSEYSHGTQLQKAASHAKEHAASIDANMNQAYHDWVVQRFGDHGEAMMLRTDSQGIETQKRWADMFLNSTEGSNAVRNEVSATLSGTEARLHANHNKQAELISKSHNIHLQYEKDKYTVDGEANRQRFVGMSDEQLNSAEVLHEKHQQNNVLKQARKIEHDAENVIQNTEIKLHKKEK